MPFAADPALYGQHAGNFNNQTVDVGFTGTSDRVKYPLRTAVLNELIRLGRQEGWNVLVGTWTPASEGPSSGGHWQRLGRAGYVAQIARSKMWVSTTGPEHIVGTRYFEVLASGTTLLLCNRPPAGLWVMDGMLVDGEHAVTFGSADELRTKIRYYLEHEDERRRIVAAAHALAVRLHSWKARAEFISAVAERAIRDHRAGTPWYTPPPRPPQATGRYAGCFLEAAGGRNRNTTTLWQEQRVQQGKVLQQ